MTCGFLMQLVFLKKKTMWFIGVEVEQETSAPPPKKNPGCAPGQGLVCREICSTVCFTLHDVQSFVCPSFPSTLQVKESHGDLFS